MAWDTSINTKYCHWNGGHPFDSSMMVFFVNVVQYACEMIQYIYNVNEKIQSVYQVL